ncbi:MAG: hypothetical protein K2X94_02425 [Amoebophilaceae bacterium]|nr:hypothetical protein [Amoebophilaceae bacterium]
MMVLKILFVYVIHILMVGSVGCTPTRHRMLNIGYQSKPSLNEEGPKFSIRRSSTQITMSSSDTDQPKNNICIICKKKEDGKGFSLCKNDHTVCLDCWEQEVYNRCLSVRPYKCLICKKEQKIAAESIDLFMQACRQDDLECIQSILLPLEKLIILECIQSILLPLEKLIISAMITGKYPFHEAVESDSFLVADHLLNLSFWSSRLLNITNSDFIYSPLYKAIENNNIHLAH